MLALKVRNCNTVIMRLKTIIAATAAALPIFLSVNAALAHQSGCHRWHSCLSDTGSYVCGDLGYSTYCGTSLQTAPQIKPVSPDITSSQSDMQRKLERLEDETEQLRREIEKVQD